MLRNEEGTAKKKIYKKWLSAAEATECAQCAPDVALRRRGFETRNERGSNSASRSVEHPWCASKGADGPGGHRTSNRNHQILGEDAHCRKRSTEQPGWGGGRRWWSRPSEMVPRITPRGYHESE